MVPEILVPTSLKCEDSREDVSDTHSIEVDLEASISRSSSIRMRSVEISGLLSQGPPGASEPPIQEFFFDLLQTQPLARR